MTASHPPIPELTRRQVRRVDELAIETYGMSGLVLMENAGRACAERLADRSRGPFAICCGKGNNGGDGFVIARHLSNAGTSVIVLMPDETPPELSPDAAANFELLKHCDVNVVSGLGDWKAVLDAADWIVDALLGTGASGAPRAPFDAAIRLMNESSRPICAIDLPSGLDCDTGELADPCVRAALTMTFVSSKVGFATKSAADVLGLIETVDIGVPRRIIDEAIRTRENDR